MSVEVLVGVGGGTKKLDSVEACTCTTTLADQEVVAGSFKEKLDTAGLAYSVGKDFEA